VIVTGGASGIGVETARVLAGAGADVTIAVRDTAVGDKVAVDIRPRTSRSPTLDLADQDSVRSFAEAWSGPVHVLVNNAGVMATPETRTARGWELQFATNHLGHFALATGLYPALAAEGARIVSVSSRGHLRSDVHLDDLHFERRAYDPWLAYGQSKTANILFAVEAYRRWAADGITANAVHPGAIIDTNLSRYMDADAIEAAVTRNEGGMKTIEQGAATSVLLAASPLLDGIGGRYFEDCNEAGPNVEGVIGYAPYAFDAANAKALWEVSTRLVEDAQ